MKKGRTHLPTQGKLKDVLTPYYRRLASGEAPVAWCTSVGPAELLRSFGFEVYFPENHGALIGARRLGSKYIPPACHEGFSPETCSYLTADIGAYLSGETPLDAYGVGAVPKPKVLVYNTNQCREVKEWFAYYARILDVPLLGIDTPRDLDELSSGLLSYLKTQWLQVIEALEKISGKKFSLTQLGRVVELSHQACSLWQQFLDSNEKPPAGHSFFDHIILMAPVVVLRGTNEAVEFYEELLNDINNQKKENVQEQYRFYWEGMPVWGKISFMADFFREQRVSVVTSTYCHSWAFDFSGDDPLEACVKAYAHIFITRSQDYKLHYLDEMTRKFSIDAMLFHDSKTCPANTNTRLAIPQRFKEKSNIPFLTFFGDLVDLRHFSQEEFSLRLEAFIEQLH